MNKFIEWLKELLMVMIFIFDANDQYLGESERITYNQ